MDLETDNPEKGQLLQKSAHHRELLEEEVRMITERSEKIITNALIIGGALALTYFLVKSVSGPEGKEKPKSRKIRLVETRDGQTVPEEAYAPEQAGVVSQIGAVLVAQATGFLLSVAKEKLMEFLQAQSEKKANTDDHS